MQTSWRHLQAMQRSISCDSASYLPNLNKKKFLNSLNVRIIEIQFKSQSYLLQIGWEPSISWELFSCGTCIPPGHVSGCTGAQNRFRHAIVGKQLLSHYWLLTVSLPSQLSYPGCINYRRNCSTMATDSWAQAVDAQEAAAESVNVNLRNLS